MLSLYERAKVIAGRSLTRSKAVFGKYADGGRGAAITDTDGVVRLDMLCALGAASLHNGGGVLSYPHRLEVEAAEMVLANVAPWASSIRFLTSGSESTHAALRIAKRVTGRSIALMGDWAYHGQQEWSSDLDYPWTKRFAHGADLSAFCAGWEQDVRAVFIEPHRWEPIDREWLCSVRRFCDRTGALLVFDEIIWGGRWALGGASEWFGIVPDLACYSKALWNGQTGSCIVGNAALAEHGEMISGTFSGSPVSLAAVLATVRTYRDEPVIETLWARGRQLAAGLDVVIPPDIALREGAAVHQRLHFFDAARGVRFMERMADRGVIWHPLVANVMYAHTPDDIDRVIAAAAASCKGL